MTMTQSAGSVVGLWRFPVKSMTGERVPESDLTGQGLVGDRGYALIDSASGKVVSAKSVREYPNLLACRASFVEPPGFGRELPAVCIELPDGTKVLSDSDNTDRVLSAWFRREVTLARTAPEDFTIDQYYPDVEDIDPAGHCNTTVEQKLGSAFFAEAGLDSPVQVGAFFDLFPLSMLTTSALARLNELQPKSRFDERRFRMNVIVDTAEGGFVENGWVDRTVSIGENVRLRVALPDPRCVMTTLPQEELPGDNDVLRGLARHNRLQVGEAGRFPCVGVYAVVQASGTIRIGDRVTVN